MGAQRDGGSSQRTGDPHGPARFGLGPRQRQLDGAAGHAERDDRGTVDRAQVAAGDGQRETFGESRHPLVQAVEVLERPPFRHRDRGQRPRRVRAFRRQVAQGKRERSPTNVLGAHPRQVEMHTFHEHVGAHDDETGRVGDDGRVVDTGCRGEIRLDPLQQAELAYTFDAHGLSMPRRCLAACTGSAASPTARMTHTR